jgi:hypothetical protein
LSKEYPHEIRAEDEARALDEFAAAGNYVDEA